MRIYMMLLCILSLYKTGLSAVALLPNDDGRNLGHRKHNTNSTETDNQWGNIIKNYRPAKVLLRMVASEMISIRELPYQVAVLRSGNLICGGCLITEWHALTAAHCVKSLVIDGNLVGLDQGDLQIRVGSSNAVQGGKLFDIGFILVHPNFERSTLKYDIAILQSFQIIKPTAKVKAIGVSRVEPEAGTIVYVSGYGEDAPRRTYEQILRGAEMIIVDRATCQKKLEESGQELSDMQICAGGNRQDSCKGDSGGPMVDRSRNVLLGIISWGVGCGRIGIPAAYTSVAKLRPWIQQEAARMIQFDTDSFWRTLLNIPASIRR